MSIEDEMRKMNSDGYEKAYVDYAPSFHTVNYDKNSNESNMNYNIPDPYAYEHGVRPIERPTVIALNIRGQMNNLTVAAAIYEAFTTCREPLDLFEIANMLQSQVRADNERAYLIRNEGRCKED